MQDFTLPFKYQSKDHPKTTKLTSLLLEDYPYFSYIYRINSKTQILLNPNSSKIAHFPIKNYYNLHFATTPKTNSFLQYHIPTSHLNFVQPSINFIEVFTDDKPDICFTIIQSSTNHIATLLKGHIGFLEVPFTKKQPKYYQVNSLNTLVHNVVHTYQPYTTEPTPLSNYNTPTKDIPSLSNHFSLHQIYMTSPTLHDKPHSNIYNDQPTFDSPKFCIFPTLPYSKDNLKFILNFNFQCLILPIRNM